jgi:N-acetyl-anhydromuramyl-L-alanine amidase AmpD
MKNFAIFYFLILYVGILFSQGDEQQYARRLSDEIDSVLIQRYRQAAPFFTEAYHLYPSVPRGMLEAVSFTYTRFVHIKPTVYQEDENIHPSTYGLMGLTLDGRGFFRNNLHYVSDLSGFSVEDSVARPRDNVVAYAAAYAALQQKWGIHSDSFEAQIPILKALSELPLSEDSVLNFALNSSLYAIAQFVDDDLFRKETCATVGKPDYFRCFGKMLPLLRAKEVMLPADSVGDIRSDGTDYSGAIWNPAGACNYSVGRGGHSVSAVTIHYTQGTYAGSIAWFQNCTYNGVGAQASAHYVVRSIDGQITQMVREADKAWHVGNSNPYTIGIEHEAYGDIASFFTPEMYQASALLVRDICDRHGISPLRMFYRDTLDDGTVLNDGLHSLGGESACVKIRGHQHFPNQSHTDPGPYWNWNYYYKLVNDDTPVTRLESPSGILTDSGGPDGDYGNDERRLWLIQVDEADRITLNFSEFDLEENYDFLWIYDGNTVYSPLLGRWNTHSPGTVTSSGNAILVEFRSDCATTAAGWMATWRSEMTEEIPETDIVWDESQWITENLQLSFEDTDEGEIPYRFYQITGCSGGTGWTANANSGFLYNDFDGGNLRGWSVLQGQWEIADGQLCQQAMGVGGIQTDLSYNQSDAYLYEFDMTIRSCAGEAGMAGIQFFSTDNSTRPNAYRIVALPTERQIRIYRVTRGNEVLLHTVDGVTIEIGTAYKFQIVHDAPSGKFLIFRNGTLLGEWRETSSLLFVTAPSKMCFLTSGTAASFDNLCVYRSRGSSVNVSVGNTSFCDLPWQAVNGTAKAKARSVILNDRQRFSPVAEKYFKVDYTKPAFRSPVNVEVCKSGETPSSFGLSAHWNVVTDSHSGVVLYEYGIASDMRPDEIRWMGVARRPQAVIVPIFRLSDPCYIAVRALNGAGLFSKPVFSKIPQVSNVKYKRCELMEDFAKEGVSSWSYDDEDDDSESGMQGQQQKKNGDSLKKALCLWPNPVGACIWVRMPSSSAIVRVFDASGRIVLENRISEKGLPQEKDVKIEVSSFRPGVYFVQSIGHDGAVGHGTFLKR